jgi:hypothetical protein
MGVIAEMCSIAVLQRIVFIVGIVVHLPSPLFLPGVQFGRASRGREEETIKHLEKLSGRET